MTYPDRKANTELVPLHFKKTKTEECMGINVPLHLPHASYEVAASTYGHSSSSNSSFTSQNSTHSSKRGAHQQASDSEDSDTDFMEQPRLPYVVGFSAVATKHEPPEPFGYGYTTEDPPELEGWKNLSQLEYCLSRPPLDGRTISHETKTLNITSIIRTGYNRGAQLVVINEDTVAKIYDPLYYEYVNRFHIKQDVIYDADRDYSCEASAYIELQRSAAAVEVTPAFRGTWTIGIDMNIRKGGKRQKHTRHVPLILIEYMRGQSMDRINVNSLSHQIRSHVLKKALDAEAVIYNAGVYHRDFCPRNIMVIGLNEGDEWASLVVKVFDFNCSTVRSHPRYEYRKYMGREKRLLKKWYPKIFNPIVRWRRQMNELSVPGWCSAEHDEQWLWDQYHDDDQYIPVVWDPENPDTRPRYVDDDSDDSDDCPDSDIELDVQADKDKADRNDRTLLDADEHAPVMRAA